MKQIVMILIFLAGLSVPELCAVETLLQDTAEPEDYQILREIITVEFSGQTPHEWGEAVPGVKTRLETADKVLAIGVDVCDLMGKGEDAKLIKFLAAENIPATLFVCGEWVDKNSAVLAKLAANPLFEIASQGLRRKACSVNGTGANGVSGTRNVDELFVEIEKNARKIEAITGTLPQYYHAGAGAYDEVAVRVINALGYIALGSSVDGTKGPGLDKKRILDLLVNPPLGTIAILGGVSLQSSFVDSAIEAVRKLRTQNYKFVKVADYPLE